MTHNFIHEKRELIFGSLSNANTVNDVESVFGAYGIEKDAYTVKANALIEFQGGVSYSSPSYQALTEKEKYRNELAIFLTGEWKKTKIYAAGINT